MNEKGTKHFGLVHSYKSDVKGRYCSAFLIAKELTQAIEVPIRVPNTTGYQVNFVDLFLTSYLDKYL